jgi:hypothetical protein
MISLCLLGWSNISLAEDKARHHKPFILATNQQGALDNVVKTTKQKLVNAGFEVAGEYSPYPEAHVIVITNNEIVANAGQSKLGGFGAGLRVTLTQAGDSVQVSYSNPVYVSHVYRMKGDMANTRKALEQSLGFKQEYGSEKGLPSDELRDYQYKWLMPEFTDTLELVKYKNQDVALAKINQALKSNKAGASKVYQINIPGKDETVIGIAMSGKDKEDCSGDRYIMSRIDFKDVRSTGHLPYEVVISNGQVYALPAEFRIAINFPDLSMMGSNSFASIMCAPDSIKETLTKAVGGSYEAY